MVLGLIIANVAVYLLWRKEDKNFMINNFTISLENIKRGRLHTLITNAFSHVDTWDIFWNMFELYGFGSHIGAYFGAAYLLKLYLAGAVGGSIFYLVHQAYKAQTEKGEVTFSPVGGLGASGAVNSIMLLQIFLFPKSIIHYQCLIPVPALLLGIFFIGEDILKIKEGDGWISGSPILAGAAVAAIAWTKVRKRRQRFY